MNRGLPSDRSLFKSILKYVAFGSLAVGVVVFAVYQFRSIQHPYQLDYGEAVVLDQALRLSLGNNIYRTGMDHPPYSVSNYPPVYIAILVPFIKSFGPGFAPGRILSILCALATAALIGKIIFDRSRSVIAAASSCLIFLSIPFVVHWSSLLRIDLMALALSVAGVAALGISSPSTGRIILSALLFTTAIYARQSYVLAAPAAAFFWILSHNKKNALIFAAVLAGMSLLVLWILNAITDDGFYYSVITANLQKVHWERTIWKLINFRNVMGVAIIVAIAFLIFYRKHPDYPFLAPYLIGSFISALTIGKLGSNVNYFLELCVAFCLVFGAMLASAERENRRLLTSILLLAIVVQVILNVEHTVHRYFPQLEARTSRIADLQELEKLVEETSGPILADEYAGMLTMNGRTLWIEPFIATQMAHEKRWNPASFIQEIEQGKFDLILIHYFEFQPLYQERWTPEMLRAIHEHYRSAGDYADTRVYRPNE